MNIRQVLVLTMLILVTFQTSVTKSDQCDSCATFKSSSDCKSFGCTWTEKTSTTPASCDKSQDPPSPTYTSFCQAISSPETNCSKTKGCAYVDGKCTNFSGCSAFQKTTNTECQAISVQCMTNGTQCTEVKECSTYTKEQCSTSLSPRSPFLCKLDGEVCREMKCIEADTKLNTDTACSEWLFGCKTTGVGCIDVLSSCTTYSGTSTSCPNMRGIEGICDFDSTTNKCAARVCTNAPTTLQSDKECRQYKTGCVTTGKGCVTQQQKCSTYKGNAETCNGYIGSDGLCIGDINGTNCRIRKCEDKEAKTNSECDSWKTGCITNGRKCAAALSDCSAYVGTTVTCLEYIANNGNCKGSGTTDSACSAKSCTADSIGTENTDAQCQAIQTKCKTNGQGCVETLSPCSSYTFTDDGTSCTTLIGSDGKCKAGTDGNCDALQCADGSTTLINNEQCNDYQTGCVSNGAGCLPQQTCEDVSLKMTCDGSKTNHCVWNTFCVQNASCDQYLNQSLCNQYKADGKRCYWENAACRVAVCTDFKGETDKACDDQLPKCYSNGTSCLDQSNCSLFTGLQASCQSKPLCTNDQEVTDETTQCKARTCDDSYLTYTSDDDCIKYLSTCVTKGNGCIDKSKGCNQYTGTQSECKNFKGDDGTKVCWNPSETSGSCQTKTCIIANNMKNDADCKAFMSDCIYDGVSSCVDKSSPCTSFTGNATTCLTFKGVNGTVLCAAGTGGKCKDRVCADNTTAANDIDCEKFLTGCLTKKNGCISPTVTCENGYTGTVSVCDTFYGNSQKCTRLDPCKSIACADKTNAVNNNACITYNPKCRISQGTNVCIDAPSTCAGYTSFAGSATLADKHAYCNLVLTSNGDRCSYDAASNACAVPSCKLWHNSLSSTCQNYMGTNSCRLDSDNACYSPDSCSNYSVPGSKTQDADKLAWCHGVFDNGSDTQYCTLDTDDTTKCTNVLTCEQAKSSTDESECNQFLNTIECQFFSGKCYTTQSSCSDYLLTGITDQANYCKALRSYLVGEAINCKYDSSSSTSNCVDDVVTVAPLTCTSIQNPQSQGDCSRALFCIYSRGSCVDKVACANYTPAGTTALDVQYTCYALIDSVTGYNCSYDSANNKCKQYLASCSAVNLNTVDACGKHRDAEGVRCTWGGMSYCSASSGPSEACAFPASSIEECEIRSLPYCKLENGNCVPVTGCSDHDVSGYTNKLGACQKKMDPTEAKCTWNGGDYCTEIKSACNQYAAEIGNELNSCLRQKDSNGNQCSWHSGSNCVRYLCTEVVNPKSQIDCDILRAGCWYSNILKVCQLIKTNCTDFTPTGQTLEDKLASCQDSYNSIGLQCTYLSGADSCMIKGACSSYDVSSLSSSSEKMNTCQAIGTSDSSGCTYYGSGNNCIQITTCTNYTGGISSNCYNIKSSDNKKCAPAIGANSATACSVFTSCLQISNPTSQDDCDNQIKGCVYYNNQCYLGKADCTYSTPGSNAKTFCNEIKNTAGDYCTALTDSQSACQQRACDDAITKPFETHQECKTYSSLCKSNGYGCVDASTTCAQQKGNPTFCAWTLDSDNQSQCVANPVATTPSACTNFNCLQNPILLTDTDCKNFNLDCLNKGRGCISKDALCTAYYGTTTTCANFVGNGKKCWSDSASTRTTCRDRTCYDKTSAVDLQDCDTFLSGCLYNGAKCVTKSDSCTSYVGIQSQCSQFMGVNNTQHCWGASTSVSAACKIRQCSDKANPTNAQDCETFLSTCTYNGAVCIPKSDPCTNYVGTQDQCSKFMGVNKTQYCWGTSTTDSAACTIRLCSDKASTSDSECNKFMPPLSTVTPNCITDGTNCTNYDRPCSFFSGTDTSCSKFTSNEGICKASSVSSTPVACAPRICIEAPITYSTNEQCQSYQKGCKTTGRGCIAVPTCNDLQTKDVCSNKTGCLWADQCRAQFTNCSDYAVLGQTICSNTVQINGIQCAWEKEECRPYVCTDYDSSFTKHSDCQAKDVTCTTSGAGCVTMGVCTSYKNQQTCEAAITTELTIRCSWSGGCRKRECPDGIFKTDSDCNAFLAGCKSSGGACIGPTYNCNVFDGYPQNCMKNSSGQPCLYVDGKCFQFDDCTDAQFTTLSVCQSFSPLCVPGKTTCQPMNTCDKYDSQPTCTIGLNSTTCGWNPSGKCAVFNTCGEANGITLQDCQNWNPKCVSDGTKCIEQGNCNTYLTEAACGNIGNDGLCQFTETGCRLRVCSDVSAATDIDCQAVSVPTGVCTTDGTKCTDRAECSSYKETGCTVGLDGIPCIYGYPAGTTTGTTTGTQSCRPKECTDVLGITNEQCLNESAITKCVSNGVNCIKQETCDKYKNKLSCRGGGSDGLCVFTSVPTEADPNAGTCQLFKQCETAKNDKDACALKLTQCRWTETTSGSTTSTNCQPMDCVNNASGTKCNPIPSFDGSTYTICVLANGVCTVGDPSTITQDQCYTSTYYSYTWNEEKGKCVTCKAGSSINNTGGNTSNPINTTTTTDFSIILGMAIPLSVMGLFI